jgi:hypothetical protein
MCCYHNISAQSRTEKSALEPPPIYSILSFQGLKNFYLLAFVRKTPYKKSFNCDVEVKEFIFVLMSPKVPISPKIPNIADFFRKKVSVISPPLYSVRTANTIFLTTF